MKQTKQAGLRVLLFIGRFRPGMKPDCGAELVKRIVRSCHTVAGVIISRNDPLAFMVKQAGIPVFALPSALDQSSSKSRAALHVVESQRSVAAWLGRLSSLNADIGVVFYGNWIPPELFNLPARGFVNYHPAPLPELRGVEPDTFAVLEGRKKMWGTVHQVALSYDSGAIVGRTAVMNVTRYMTPVVVWNTLTTYGIDAILRVLDRFRDNTAVFEKQAGGSATDAGRHRTRRASVIQWKTDDADMLRRRLLAFCGQDISIRLKADVAGRRYCVRDLETHRGRFPGKPGDLVCRYEGRGRFRGQPVVRTGDGVAVLALGTEILPGMKNPEEPLGHLIPPRRRNAATDIRIIRKICGSHKGRRKPA